jgi:hypothetical protein
MKYIDYLKEQSLVLFAFNIAFLSVYLIATYFNWREPIHFQESLGIYLIFSMVFVFGGALLRSKNQ